MNFRVIDEMGPFQLVTNEEEKVGLIDAEGNVCVPCEMDDVFESGVDDNCLMSFIKDGKYGFLLPNGKYIEPVYDDFIPALIEGVFSVHVHEGDVYGFYVEPDYEYRKVESRENSLFAFNEDDLCSDDVDDEYVEFEDSDAFSVDGCDFEELFVKKQELHDAGYALAEAVWVEKYADLDAPDMKEYTEAVISQFKSESNEFIDSIERLTKYVKLEGAIEFMSDKCLANVDIPNLNKKIQKHINENNEEGYWTLMFGLMNMFEFPDYGKMKGKALFIPAEMRPFTYMPLSFGRIGRLYIAEHGMRMYKLCADIYDADDPEQLVEENCILGDDNNCYMSELIELVQNLKDPDKKNQELSLMLEKAKAIEAEKCYGHILSDHGMYAFCAAKYPEASGSYDYVYVYDGILYVVKSFFGSLGDALTPKDSQFSCLLENLKADINIAAARLKKQQES